MAVLHYRLSVVCDIYTTPNNLVEAKLSLDKLTVSNISVEFPAGCCGLVQVRVYLNALQVIPWGQDTFLSGDNRVIHVPIELPLENPPYELRVTGYNLDDTYIHTIFVDVDVKENTAVTFESAVLTQLIGGKQKHVT